MITIQVAQPPSWLATALPALIGAIVGGLFTGIATWLGVWLTAGMQRRAASEEQRRDLILRLADAAEDVADVLDPQATELNTNALHEARRRLRRLVRSVVAFYRDDKAAGPFARWIGTTWLLTTAMADGTNEHFVASREARGEARQYVTTMAQEAQRWLTGAPADWKAPATTATADPAVAVDPDETCKAAELSPEALAESQSSTETTEEPGPVSATAPPSDEQ